MTTTTKQNETKEAIHSVPDNSLDLGWVPGQAAAAHVMRFSSSENPDGVCYLTLSCICALSRSSLRSDMLSVLFVSCCIFGAQHIKRGKDTPGRGVEVEVRVLYVVS